MSDALLRGAINEDADPTDIGERVMSQSNTRETGSAGEPNFFEKAYVMAMLPLILGAQVVRFAIFISSVVLVGPIVSFMWRTRRHLADAMAVQLTRYPDGLVRALHKLSISPTAAVKGAGGSRVPVRRLAGQHERRQGGGDRAVRAHAPQAPQASAPAPRARRHERVGRAGVGRAMDARQMVRRRPAHGADRASHGRRARRVDRRARDADHADAHDHDGPDVRGVGRAQAAVFIVIPAWIAKR